MNELVVNNLIISEEDIYETSMSLLRGKIFHATPIESFNKIIKDGCICGNKDGKLGCHWSENSFGRNRGYVCLFDFVNKTDKTIENCLESFSFLSPRVFGEHIGFFVFPLNLSKNLLFSDDARLENISGEKYMPDVECWYPSNLSLDYCLEAFTVKIHPLHPPDPYVKALCEAQ